MIRTQIQLPDDLYRELKRLSEVKEWSLAETLRRAAELFLNTHPAGVVAPAEWKLPGARHCGPFLAAPDDWTELAHEEAS